MKCLQSPQLPQAAEHARESRKPPAFRKGTKVGTEAFEIARISSDTHQRDLCEARQAHSCHQTWPHPIHQISTSPSNSPKFGSCWKCYVPTRSLGGLLVFFFTSLYISLKVSWHITPNSFTVSPTALKQICPHRNTTTILSTLPAMKKAKLDTVFITAGFSDCY